MGALANLLHWIKKLAGVIVIFSGQSLSSFSFGGIMDKRETLGVNTVRKSKPLTLINTPVLKTKTISRNGSIAACTLQSLASSPLSYAYTQAEVPFL